jgi:hypothetical protein
MFIGPLGILGIQVGASLLGNMLGGGNKRSGSSQAIESSIAGKNRAETELLRQKQRFLNDLAGFRSNVQQDIIDPKTGKPLVIKLPGVGGVGGDEFDRLLRAMVEGTDFGSMREMDLLQTLTQLSSPGSNTAGAGANVVAQDTAGRRANSSGLASFLSDAGQGLARHFTSGGNPVAGAVPQLTQIAPIQEIDTSFLTPEFPEFPRGG